MIDLYKTTYDITSKGKKCLPFLLFMQIRDVVCLDSQSIVGVKHDVIVLDSPSPTKSPAKKKMKEEKIVPEVNLTLPYDKFLKLFDIRRP